MALMPSPGSRRWLRPLVAVPVALVLAAAAVAAVVVIHSPHNVSHPSVEFTAPPTTSTATTPAKPAADAPPFLWPRYGYDAARTRDFTAAGRSLNPPLRVGWRYQDYALLEFPPVIDGHTLYLDDDDASAKAIDARTGHLLWQHKLGNLAAAS